MAALRSRGRCLAQLLHRVRCCQPSPWQHASANSGGDAAGTRCMAAFAGAGSPWVQAAGLAAAPAAPAPQPPRRALLYVPGNDERKIRKAATQLLPDCICMDMEDGVAMNRKEEARSTITRLLGELETTKSELAVRINAVGSGLAAHDLQALLGAKRLPDAIVVPKVDTVEDVAWLYKRVQALAGARIRAEGRRPALITMCESAMGLLDLRLVFEAALDPSAPLELQGCILGGDDMAASLSATRTASNAELQWARQALVVHCRAYKVQAIDIVKIDFHDTAGLECEAAEGAQLGFSGKQVIHPTQVGPTHAAFTPSSSAMSAAAELIAAFEAHQATGHGAFVHQGRMIDAPTMLQARNVLALAQRLGARADGKEGNAPL